MALWVPLQLLVEIGAEKPHQLSWFFGEGTLAAARPASCTCGRRTSHEGLEGNGNVGYITSLKINGWNLRIIQVKREIIFQTSIFLFQCGVMWHPVMQSDHLIPYLEVTQTFQRVTFSPSQKGHKELPRIYITLTSSFQTLRIQRVHQQKALSVSLELALHGFKPLGRLRPQSHFSRNGFH